MNNLNPLYENIGMGIAGGAIGSIPGIVAGTMTYQAIVNHKRKSYCKQLLENMDLNSLLKEAYDCCESIYHTKGEYRETLYTMCYPKLVEALKTKDINKLKSSILNCIPYSVKTKFLKQIYKKFPYNNKTEAISSLAGGAIGAGLLGYGMYNM